MKGKLNEITLLQKTRGEGVPSSIALTSDPGPVAPTDSVPAVDIAPLTSLTSAEPQTQDESALCQHIDAQGRRCRMLVMSIEEDLCAYHAQRRQQNQSGRETAAAELLACGTDFGDASAVNRFLGALVRQVTLKRIPRRDAVTLAYLCQLLLNSLGAIDREQALRLEESRIAALNRSKRPPKIIWDIPGPPYEPIEPEVIPKNSSGNKSGSR
jgi:hypothetical protein